MLAASCSVLRLPPSLIVPMTGTEPRPADERRSNATSLAFGLPLSEVWKADAPAGYGPAPAVIVDSLLFYGDLHGELHVLRLMDGHEVGSKSYGSAIFGAPLLDRDTMYLALSRSEPNLMAYLLSTGTTVWKSNLPDIETDLLRLGGRLYAATYRGTLYCIDKSTGNTLWRFDVPADARTRIIRSSPASDGGTIVFGCDDGSMFAVSADSGTLRWRANARESIVSFPSIESGSVVFGSLDSTLYAVDIRSGKKMWERALGSHLVVGQAVHNGRIYTATAAGELYSLGVSDGRIYWWTQLKSMAGAAPFVADTVLFVGCMDKHLYAYGTTSGDLLWDAAIGGRVRSTPIVGNGRMVILADDRTVHAFQSTGPKP